MKISLLLILTAMFSQVFAQSNISGTINLYEPVTAISGNVISVASTGSFSPGDTVLIIQMQGAEIDESNSALFGDVVAYNETGNYEFLTICSVLSSTELAVSDIQRSYDPSQGVQLVTVPNYEDAEVNATLTGNSWDGTSGGVIVLSCNGTLTLNADISMMGNGFNGASITTSSYSCQWFFQPSDYFYELSSGEGAKKGEGIAQYITNKTGGRGAQANGGGGGNDHNTGGGGGANGGDGGQGGERIPEGTFSCSGDAPGEGGKSNIYNLAENKVFMGGAGGAGHENNAGLSSDGGFGGGIVIIIADEIIGNGYSILASGEDSGDANDGAGGGGAGGTVLLDVNTVSGSLNIDVSGGSGGGISNFGTGNCNGPGGGGGGGVLWTSGAVTPPGIVLDNSGGNAGTTLVAAQSNCTVGGTNSASDGQQGIEMNNLNLPMPNILTGTDSRFECDSLVWIDGITYYADNNTASYLISGGSFYGCDSLVLLDLSIGTVDASVMQVDETLSANQNGAIYQWVRCPAMSLISGATDQVFTATENGEYAVIIDNGGCIDTSSCFTVAGIGIEELGQHQIQVYPNPANGAFTVDLGEDFQEAELSIFDLNGALVYKGDFYKVNKIEIELALNSGVYTLMIQSPEQLYLKKLIMN